MTREMKDSGVEWIGRIPKTWVVKAGKYCLTLLKRIPSSDDQVVTCFRDGEVTLRSERREEGFTISEKEIGYQGVKKGDLVVHGMDGFAGAIGISKFDGKGSPILNVLDSYSNKQFLAYYLRAAAFKGYFLATATGIRVRSCDLRWPKLAKMPILLPPLAAQQAIADYLDSKCSQIDQLTDNIKQQIASLSEYKKALITQAVTKGLDPDVEMKDSGIEWIGKIPSHWSILRIANIYTERSETGCKDDLPILMVSINSGVSNGEVLDEERTRMVVRSEDKLLYKRVYPDDLVYNTMRAWQGAFGAVRVNGLVSPAYVTAAPKIDIDSRYIEYLLRTPPAKEEMKRYSYGIADFRMRLYWQYFKNISVALPPLDEQHHIASFIDSSYFKIDSVIKKKSELLETLQDYKKSLIYDYVTGKREVPVSYRKGGSHE